MPYDFKLNFYFFYNLNFIHDAYLIYFNQYWNEHEIHKGNYYTNSNTIIIVLKLDVFMAVFNVFS
jgi:hypothetical protein